MTVATRSREAGRAESLEALGTAFKGALAAVRRLRGRDTHRPGELSFAQYHLLFGLQGPDAISTGELAAKAELTPATVTQMLDALVEMGLVERARSTSDRRVVMCSLTQRGHDLVAERRRYFEGLWRENLSDFSADELAVAAAVVGRLQRFYEDILVGAAGRDAPGVAPADEA